MEVVVYLKNDKIEATRGGRDFGTTVCPPGVASIRFLHFLLEDLRDLGIREYKVVDLRF